MDPHALLDLPPGASPAEVTRAFRRAARRWHPDVNASPEAQERMAGLNAAYELLRSGSWQRRPPGHRPARPHPAARAADRLDDATRRALGDELARSLDRDEDVELVSPAATWASPRTLLALTDRRLLWLLDDAPVHRVRYLRFRDVAAVEARTPRLRRRTASLEVRSVLGRRLSWAELRPATAAWAARYVAERLPVYAGTHG